MPRMLLLVDANASVVSHANKSLELVVRENTGSDCAYTLLIANYRSKLVT